MRKKRLHIIILLLVVLTTGNLFAQKTRYVEQNSIHGLTVPYTDGYNYHWTIKYGVSGETFVGTKTNVTQNISWDYLTTYHITVIPELDSVGCYGEPQTLDVIVVEFLSLHAFDDVFFTDRNTAVSGDVGVNDVDETGATIYYNPAPIDSCKHGTLVLMPNGNFTYTPDNNFVGIDSFVYEVYNDHDIPMYTSATVYIVVQDDAQVADLRIDKTGPEKALYGAEIEYLLTVTNFGPDVAKNVVVKDTLAFGLFNPSYLIEGSPQPWEGDIRLGNMAPGDSTVIYIYADISPYSPDKIYNQGLVYSETYDPNHVDNDSIWITEIAPIFVDLPNTIHVPSCETAELPGNSASQNTIAYYEWIPATGLSNPTIGNPIFTPDTSTIGKITEYILKVTDEKGNIALDTTYIIVPEAPEAIITGDTLFKDIGEDIVLAGDQSIGQELSYLWYTNNGNITGLQNTDSIKIDTIGDYYLRISDYLGCTSIDSAIVLLRSHPPLAVNDSVTIVAGTDSSINVLLNDRDINNFSLHVDSIVTPPKHSVFTWDAAGNINIRPNADYWKTDSLEYRVCNKGIPQQCSTAWVIIDSKRPPLNTDMVIEKTGPEIAFWGDTIYYNINVSSLGPDTAVNTTVVDRLPPAFFNIQYSVDEGNNWLLWSGSYTYADSIRPLEDTLRISIKAAVRDTSERHIENLAYLSTKDILENDYENDTARWESKMKILVQANAGNDTIIGYCNPSVQLNASLSTGENLSYKWSPAQNLSSANAVNPIFYNPGKAGDYTLQLVVSDDDNITDTAYVTVHVLPPPLADAGPDKFLEEGSVIGVGGNSSGYRFLQWTTDDGNIISGSNGEVIGVDTIGTYILTATDEAGCISRDTAQVFWFYFHPFAIPDYYSVKIGNLLTDENVIDNDHEPNGMFKLFAVAGSYKSEMGGTVVMKEDGSFTYTPPGGAINKVDAFTYEVCNDAEPPRCSYGYAKISINNDNKIANLHITKEAVYKEALIEYKNGVLWKITVENKGDETATNVFVTDTLSASLKDAQYSFNQTSWLSWGGQVSVGNLTPGESVSLYIRATAKADAPSLIYNAAVASSGIFDNQFAWLDIDNRNVDTASVHVTNDLLAVAELLELHPGDNINDNIIGFCDESSKLSARNSKSTIPIEAYSWSPAYLLQHPDSLETRFNHPGVDTTVTFTLTVMAGGNYAFANIDVKFSPELIADAGPDRKINQNESLVIDATNSQGAGVDWRWYLGAIEQTNFEDGNPLKLIVDLSGTYQLTAEDMHGCTDIDYVNVRENDLFSVSDFVIVIANDTIHANVSTNDYDPNNDNISYSGWTVRDPQHGTLLSNPLDAPAAFGATAAADKISPGGWFTYVPERNYVGYDFFTYEVCDDNDPELCVEGRVYIRVVDVVMPNSLPVANPDYLFVNRNDTARTNILANDFDFDGGLISYDDIVMPPGKGEVSVDESGNLVYIPNPDVVGDDYFQYRICDNGKPSLCDTAGVFVEIHKIPGENHRPVAVDDAAYAVEKTIYGNVLTNDYDPDGNPIELNPKPIMGPFHGDFEVDRQGNYIYQPDENFEGTDMVVYEICENFTSESYCSYATLYIVAFDEPRYTTDLSIEKSGDSIILSGETITYQLDVKVIGPTLANDVVISDPRIPGLKNYEYSRDGVRWNTWNDSIVIERMMLYDDTTIWLRADLPDRYSGDLINVANMSHDMVLIDEDNNTSTLTTKVYQRVIANAGPDTLMGICKEVYEIDSIYSVGMADLEFSWTPTELIDDPGSPLPEFTLVADTTIEFMLVVSSEVEGIFDTDTAYFTLDVGENPVARAGEDIYPVGDESVSLDGSASTGAGKLEYLWWNYDLEGNLEEITTNVGFDTTRSGEFYLTVIDMFGCESEPDRVNVIYPVDDFVAVDDNVITEQQQSIDIYVLLNDIIDTEEDEYDLERLVALVQPKHGTLYRNPTDSFFTYVPHPYYYGPDTFMYAVFTRYFNDVAEVYINVEKMLPEVPEAFSPNGDGVHDYLEIKNIELYEEYSLVIFNRWGNIVYEVKGYVPDGNFIWDGVANKGIRIGNGPVPTGVYYYILDLGNDERIKDPPLTGFIYVASSIRR